MTGGEVGKVDLTNPFCTPQRGWAYTNEQNRDNCSHPPSSLRRREKIK